jgi:hypothetical protein
MKITCADAVLALKKMGVASPAKNIAARLGTDSRAVATALRGAVADGRVTIAYRRGIGSYRFKRLSARKAST